MPATQPRYLPRTDELPSRSTAAGGQGRVEDLDVPAFIRKKAD